MNMDIDEEMRMSLLAEEFKLRKKQPPAWTMQKYRKYANFGANRKKKEEAKGLGAKSGKAQDTKSKS